jgi:hypothetical protein
MCAEKGIRLIVIDRYAVIFVVLDARNLSIRFYQILIASRVNCICSHQCNPRVNYVTRIIFNISA